MCVRGRRPRGQAALAAIVGDLFLLTPKDFAPRNEACSALYLGLFNPWRAVRLKAGSGPHHDEPGRVANADRLVMTAARAQETRCDRARQPTGHADGGGD